MSFKDIIFNPSPTKDLQNKSDPTLKDILKDYGSLDGLGAGAFGKVLKYIHNENGKVYAIKIMSKHKL